MNIDTELSYIKGVGPKTLEYFNRNGIFTVLDLLLYFPRDYENISLPKKIQETVENEKVLIKCSVVQVERDVRTNTGKVLTTVILTDGDSKFKAKWFNQPYMKNKFLHTEEIKLLGKVSSYRGEKVLANPTIVNDNEKASKNVIPVYPLKQGLSNNIIRKAVMEVLTHIHIEENLPKWFISKHCLCSLDEAVRAIHCPQSASDMLDARKRLKYQELFTYSIKVLVLKENIVADNKGIPFTIAPELKELKDKLPFELTDAQNRVVREILIDEKKNISMNRLVQGDVGSGKTIVAIISMFNIVKNGYQTAMMAPTEILALQHFEEINHVLKDYDIKTALLSGSLSAKEKENVKNDLKDGKIDILVGTHALIEENVQFKKLGMVVTDEQHRFGVMQRSRLFNKGHNIDILVMTATPIPRTLALYLYGDLDVSVIDKLPPGRQKIDTFYIKKSEKGRAYEFALKQIKEGRQVYLVCPLVQESEELDLSSVEEIYGELKETYFKGINIEMIHGKLSPKIKNEIMDRFKLGEIKLLVSTTVIEVGVNVPNASLMIIENAERFGLAQLHQLRGRVGRGEYKSTCILIADIKSNVTKKRMEIMKKSNDGFYIAEEDLKIRGGGEIFGFRQHGEDEFILSDVVEDVNILRDVNCDAKTLLHSDDFEDIRLRKEIVRKLNMSTKYICFN